MAANALELDVNGAAWVVTHGGDATGATAADRVLKITSSKLEFWKDGVIRFSVGVNGSGNEPAFLDANGYPISLATAGILVKTSDSSAQTVGAILPNSSILTGSDSPGVFMANTANNQTPDTYVLLADGTAQVFRYFNGVVYPGGVVDTTGH